MNKWGFRKGFSPTRCLGTKARAEENTARVKKRRSPPVWWTTQVQKRRMGWWLKAARPSSLTWQSWEPAAHSWEDVTRQTAAGLQNPAACCCSGPDLADWRDWSSERRPEQNSFDQWEDNTSTSEFPVCSLDSPVLEPADGLLRPAVRCSSGPDLWGWRLWWSAQRTALDSMSLSGHSQPVWNHITEFPVSQTPLVLVLLTPHL